jgi:hypothetical protein
MLKINKNLYIFYFCIIFFIGFFININTILAAEINFSPTNGKYHVGDTIKIKVVIASDKSVNAVSSNISFPFDILSLTSLSKSSSLINLWAQEPTFSNNNGSVSFEGVILNGYTGNNGNIITLVFKAKRVGVANLNFKNASILANDGNGTDLFSGKLTTATLNIEKEIKVDKPIIETETEKTTEVIDNVVEKITEVEITNKLPNHSLLVTIIVLLITLIILLIFYIFFILVRIKRHFKDKLLKAENVVYKNFKTLEKEIDNTTNEPNIAKNSDIIKKDEEKSVLKEVMETESNIIKEIEEIKD